MAWHKTRPAGLGATIAQHRIHRRDKKEQMLLHMILNAYWEPLDFELPPIDGDGNNVWRLWIDTSLDSPNDICEWQTSPPVSGLVYRAAPHSVVVLWSNSSSGL